MSISQLASWIYGVYRRVFFDIWRKLIALLLALLTWFGVRWYLMQQQTLRVQVRVDYDASEYHVSGENHEFTVWLAVRRLNRDDGNSDWTEPLNYDLSVRLPDNLEVPSGEYRFTLNDLVAEKKPSNVSFLSMEPEALSVKYDRLESKLVRVRLPEDVPLGGRKVVFTAGGTSQVRLTGPSSYLKDLDEILPDTSGVRDILQESIPKKLVLSLKRPYAQVQVLPAQVEFNLHQEQIVRDMSESFACPVLALSVGKGLLLEEGRRQVTVRVSGPPSVFERWKDRQVLAYADLGSVKKPGTVSVAVAVGGIPSGLSYTVAPQRCSFALSAVPPAAASKPAAEPSKRVPSSPGE